MATWTLSQGCISRLNSPSIQETSMPGKSSKKSGGNKPKKTGVNPPLSAVVYRGPPRLPRVNQANDLMTTQINNAGQVATSGTGTVTTVFSAYSQLSVAGDWTNLSNLYTEYRILSMEVEFIPWNTFNMPTTNILSPVYTVEARDTATALSGLNTTVAFDSCRVVQPSKRFTRTIKMASLEEAQFVPVGTSPASTAQLYVKLWSSGNSNSITLYDFITRIIVQMRGRQWSFRSSSKDLSFNPDNFIKLRNINTIKSKNQK